MTGAHIGQPLIEEDEARTLWRSVVGMAENDIAEARKSFRLSVAAADRLLCHIESVGVEEVYSLGRGFGEQQRRGRKVSALADVTARTFG